MTPRTQSLVLNGLAGLALLLVLLDGSLLVANRATQHAVAARQNEVQQAAQLQLLQRDIAKALADLAIKSGDRSVLQMLASNGITVTLNTTAAAPGAPGAPRQKR